MGRKVLRQILTVALVVGCASDHEVATLDRHDVEGVCQALCRKSAECEQPAPWCDDTGCDDCVAQCIAEANATGDWDPEDDYCQRLLDAAIDCAHEASCAYYFDGIGEKPASCLRAERAQLACYGEDLDTPGTSASTSASSGAGGSGGFGGTSVTSGFGGNSSVTTVSAGGTGSLTTGSATSTGTSLTFVPIPFANGWASLNDNNVGIQGAFYTFDDNETGGTSLIEPESFAESGTSICIQGIAGRVEDGPDGTPAYADYWGASVGFNLSQEEGSDLAYAYDATYHRVVGFQFRLETLEFPDEPGELRFNVRVAGDANYYCRTVARNGLHTFLLNDLWQSCWENYPDTPGPDPSRLVSLEWHFVTNTTSSYPFEMCIGSLEVITD